MLAPAFDGGGGRQITVGRGTENTSPSFSPDGRQVAFMSGRSGHPEVYISDVDGTNAELLTPYVYGERSYRASPDWSPANQAVAFQSEIGGSFQIMTIGLRDRAMKQHTSEGLNEDPSWAPDGRHLVFTSTRTGTRQLFVLDTESGRVRQLTKGGGSRLAAWSRTLAGAQ
jgi:TolB protein